MKSPSTTSRGSKTGVLQGYLEACAEIRNSGNATDETSYYPALKSLFDDVGARLDPTVKSVMNLRNLGAGLPDGGLFTADQMQRRAGNGLAVVPPARGAIEAKGPKRKIPWLFEQEQTKVYSKRYGQVLLTNLREFALVVDDSDGRRIVDEVSIAGDDVSWWKLVDRPDRVNAEVAERIEDFLLRALTRGAPMREASDIASLLASYAREAKARMPAADPPGLRAVRSALEASLGLRFTGKEGDHFFHSTLIQTLFYGIFSAWVLWSKEPKRKPNDRFEWRQSAWYLHVPMVRSLFEQVATPTMLGPLRLVPILDAVADALSRVDRVQFFATFDSGQTVQHFYEPFLRKFDPELRKKMGVWFTPPELVEYMVSRVDHVLRTELNLPNGLADPNVYILDPCVGTGSFLVAVLRKIAERIGVGNDASAALKLKQIVLQRLYGFELIPAPYVVAHLQIGLLLQGLGVPLREHGGVDERAMIYLSNALTGWKTEDQQIIPFPQFEEERDAANKVKRDSPILVVLGNPPYDGFSGVSPLEEKGLIDGYKAGLRAWGMTKNKLDDPYIRFFRIAQDRISQHAPHRGIVCYVSNDSWIHHKTAVPVRESLLQDFDKFWVDNLHGNRHISEYGPDGKTSETIFALPGFSPGIKQGVAVSLWLKRGIKHADQTTVLYRDDFNASRADERRKQLLASLGDPDPDSSYTVVTPERERFFAFTPAAVSPHYRSWPSVDSLCAIDPSLGLNENRKNALIALQRDELAARMEAYFGDAGVRELRKLGGEGFVDNASGYVAAKVRQRMKSDHAFTESAIQRFGYHPFDKRWSYVVSGPLWNRWRPELVRQIPTGTRFVVFRRNAVAPGDGVGLLITREIGDQHLLHKDGYFIPMRYTTAGEGRALGMFDEVIPNFSAAALAYLRSLGYSDSQIARDEGEGLWFHCLAVAHSPAYQEENADDLAIRPPRIPLPASREQLERSAGLGRQLADLSDTDAPVRGITAGKVATSLLDIAKMVKHGDKPVTEDDLEITAPWGRRSKNVVSGGKGKIVAWRDGDVLSDVEAVIENASGEITLDIYLNDEVYWKGIPREAWSYSVAGYQVLKKWLSYRSSAALGRAITIDEAREFADVVRRITTIVRMGAALDENYAQAKASHREGTQERPEQPGGRRNRA